jgi:hypothetical protein
MKNFLRISSCGICLLAAITFADNFKSIVITSGGPQNLPRVHGDQFMVIRNFTQEGSASNPRGAVMISTDGGVTWIDVLAAAVLDTSKPPEVINSVVIAGPADVRATCGVTTVSCFISFKKDSN